MLALAADLARRMVQGNPHLDNPLKSEAVVLIDEVELHLHPAWQQRILGDLQRTFPNAQFIVSTHSPQVLTTVEPQRIVKLYWEDDRIVAGAPEGATYGAEAGDVLSLVMGVNERPDNDFTKDLDEYRRLVSEGKGESEEALALREQARRSSLPAITPLPGPILKSGDASYVQADGRVAVKVIRELNKPTPGLAEYLKAVGDNANWDDFRDHNKGASYNELIEKLIDVQHGLCGYCEINLCGAILEFDRQIEHVIPQGDPQQGASKEVDVTNMIACCKGGTWSVFASSEKSSDEDRYLEPVKDNMSCGQAKGDRNDADFLDPRKLPALPSLTKVLVDGRIEADEEACESADIPTARVTRTIEILNLNAERLTVSAGEAEERPC